MVETVAQVAAPKKVKLSLTDLERVVFERCRETGDTPDEAVLQDTVLVRQLLKEVLKNTRKTRIQERLDNDLLWVQKQVMKLRAGVREPKDEPGYDEAVRRMQSGSDELHGAPEETVGRQLDLPLHQ